jgi:tRNA 2-thiouridine synthesizing protein B
LGIPCVFALLENKIPAREKVSFKKLSLYKTMTLHIFNSQDDLTKHFLLIKGALNKEDAVLLIENAVYAGQKNLSDFSKNIYVLKEDCMARAITEQINASCTLVDYSGFVTLTEQHTKIISW